MLRGNEVNLSDQHEFRCTQPTLCKNNLRTLRNNGHRDRTACLDVAQVAGNEPPLRLPTSTEGNSFLLQWSLLLSILFPFLAIRLMSTRCSRRTMGLLRFLRAISSDKPAASVIKPSIKKLAA